MAQRQRRDWRDAEIIIAPILAKCACAERQSRCPTGAGVGPLSLNSFPKLSST